MSTRESTPDFFMSESLNDNIDITSVVHEQVCDDGEAKLGSRPDDSHVHVLVRMSVVDGTSTVNHDFSCHLQSLRFGLSTSACRMFVDDLSVRRMLSVLKHVTYINVLLDNTSVFSSGSPETEVWLISRTCRGEWLFTVGSLDALETFT